MKINQLPPETRKSVFESSAETTRFIFQLLATLVLSNAIFVYFTNGTGMYVLRPLQTITFFNAAVFVIYCLYVISYIYAASLAIRTIDTSRRPHLLFVFLLNFASVGIFYAMSYSFRDIDSNPQPFFGLLIAYLLLDWLLDISTTVFIARRIWDPFIFLDPIWATVLFLQVYIDPPFVKYSLIATFFLETIIDYSILLNLYFPFAQNKSDRK